MTPKGEGKLQKDVKELWTRMGFRVKKTHEMLSSGKPDLRVAHPARGQLDLELKHKTTGKLGIKTGITLLQNITMIEMNSFAMPAVGLVYSEPDGKWFVTIEEEENIGELGFDRWLSCVSKKAPDPHLVYDAARRYLHAKGYREAASFIR